MMTHFSGLKGAERKTIMERLAPSFMILYCLISMGWELTYNSLGVDVWEGQIKSTNYYLLQEVYGSLFTKWSQVPNQNSETCMHSVVLRNLSHFIACKQNHFFSNSHIQVHVSLLPFTQSYLIKIMFQYSDFSLTFMVCLST